MRAPLALAVLLALSLAGCADETDDHDGHDMDAMPADPGPGASMDVPRTHEVVMASNEFTPATLTVRVGDTVHWTTEDVQAHNVVSESPVASFRSEDVSIVPLLYGGTEFSYTFDAAGVVDYVCEYHDGMVGTITVEA